MEPNLRKGPCLARDGVWDIYLALQLSTAVITLVLT